MLHYHIKPKNLGAHLVTVTITASSNDNQMIAKLPKWIPGSYKIRDYSRFVQAFTATNSNGTPLNWHKADSDTWVVDTVDTVDTDTVTLCYDVYAYDLSVRGAYLDDTRFFFNHCCVAFDIVEHSDAPRTIDIQTVADWKIFTSLPQNDEGLYTADSYNHQIDCPVESAHHYMHSEFTLNDVRHEIVFTGYVDDNDDIDAMTQRIKNICQAEMQLFEGTPLDKYLFLNYIEPKQYGGLEHKNSVAQVASPDMLMKKGKPLDNRMIDFFGLCSHEYFHLWNVKRLQPKDFQPYNLYREQNTEMLWFFEGVTSYYDELFLLRAGIVDAQTFLNRQAENLSRVLAVPGRLLQPLAASSFDAWTKLYQADANSPNNMVSYYSKGAVFILYLDLFIRSKSKGKYSTDDMMRQLWTNLGQHSMGIDENIVFTTCAQLVPTQHLKELTELFVIGLHGTDDPHTSDSGIKIDAQGKIIFLNAHSNAAEVGVSVDDTIIAINHCEKGNVDFDKLLSFGSPNDMLHLTLSRRGRVFEKDITLAKPQENQISLTLDKPLDTENSLANSWLATWIK